MSVGNEDRDVASDPTDAGEDRSEHAAEVSGDSGDAGDASDEASVDADDVDASAATDTL